MFIEIYMFFQTHHQHNPLFFYTCFQFNSLPFQTHHQHNPLPLLTHYQYNPLPHQTYLHYNLLPLQTHYQCSPLPIQTHYQYNHILLQTHFQCMLPHMSIPFHCTQMLPQLLHQDLSLGHQFYYHRSHLYLFLYLCD